MIVVEGHVRLYFEAWWKMMFWLDRYNFLGWLKYQEEFEEVK